jgi:fructose-1,6-bisphosphatase
MAKLIKHIKVVLDNGTQAAIVFDKPGFPVLVQPVDGSNIANVQTGGTVFSLVPAKVKSAEVTYSDGTVEKR